MQEYNQVSFMAPKLHTLYYGDLLRTMLLLERGIYLEKVLENLQAFHDRLMANGWRCLTPDPCKKKNQWVWELYANLSVVSFLDPSIKIIRIRGKHVDFGIEKINDIYRLPKASMYEFKAKGCETGSRLEDNLCHKKEVSQVVTKRNISTNDFTAEAQIWLTIFCSWVSPCTNMIIVPNLRARMVAYILDVIPLNVG